MLLCPLTVKDRPSGDELIGLIAVFAEHRILADLSATLEILAHQTALTMESILLRQEVIRQRNEAYFRALVQDASDAIVMANDVGSRLAHIHLADGTGVSSGPVPDEHLVPGRGKQPCAELLRGIAATGYQGMVVLVKWVSPSMSSAL